MLVLEPKSFAIQYRIDLTHIQQVSLSKHNDFLFILHIDPVSSQVYQWQRDQHKTHSSEFQGQEEVACMYACLQAYTTTTLRYL